MKNHDRHISSEVKLFKPAPTDLSPYRFEVVAKNFKKKQTNPDGHISGSANFLKMEAYRKTQTRSSPNRSESRTKTSRKRSLQKFVTNQRVEKTGPLHPVQTHQSTLSTKSKLMKINGILGQRVNGSSKEMVIQIYERYEEYLSLVKQWKHLDIFDEVDKLLQNLVDSQMKIVEDLLQETLKSIQTQLIQYQNTITILRAQNNRLSIQVDIFSKFNEVLNPIKERLMQQYEKSQWSTFIMNSLAQNSFDVENYIKTIPLYQKWVAPVVLFQGDDLHSDSKESLNHLLQTGRQRWANVFEKRQTQDLELEKGEKRRESL